MEAAEVPGSAIDPLLVVMTALAPAIVAACQVGNVADAAHDAGVARVLGPGAQPWRALDGIPQLALVALPVGSRAARAAAGEAVVAGVAGSVVFLLARDLLRRCAPASAFGSTVAAIAAMAALLAPPWQQEGGAGGASLAALLGFVPLLCLMRALPIATPGSAPDGAKAWRGAAFFLALVAGHAPVVGAGAALACSAAVLLDARLRASLGQHARGLGGWALAGALPGLFAIVRARAVDRSVGVFASGLVADGSARGTLVSALGYLRGELGTLQALLVVAGVVLAALLPRARQAAGALLVLVFWGPVCGALGAPASVTQVSAPLLVAFAAASVLAGVAMQALVRAVAATKLRFARASAAMVVVLELVTPVEAADESLLRSGSREGVAVWDELAWGALPPRAVVLLTDPRLGARALAARAQGSLRDDVTVVLAFPTARRAGRVSRDSGLVPLWRDLEIDGAPGQVSLSALATTRAVATAYESRWGKELGRHLVPLGLFDLFEPEPRGASDRRKALAAFHPVRERLAKACLHDPVLNEVTAILLRARAAELAENGDRDLIGGALADLRAFDPGD